MSHSREFHQKWRPPDLAQPADGYRFTTDAFLLASFARSCGGTRWCDLGTGSGVIAHHLAGHLGGNGLAIERQPELLAFARQNLFQLPVTLIAGDLRFHPWRPQSLDLVVCNPPYYEVHAGHINRDSRLAEARHTFFGNVVDFAECLAPALDRGGTFCFVFPWHLHHRVLASLTEHAWYLHRRLQVSSWADKEPKLVCLAISRQRPAAIQEQQLVIYQAHRHHTVAMNHFLLTGEII